MSSKFYSLQREKQSKLLGSPTFNGDNGGGKFMGRTYNYVLKNGDNNIFQPILEKAKLYFSENNISWWAGDTPSGHILSSQIACINHLMPLIHDKDAVLAILNAVSDEFTDVLSIPCDKQPAFIAFEVVSKKQHLNEKTLNRGSNCTSVDAFIYAKHKSGSKWLIPIEWKYTEHYATLDKSTEDRPNEPKDTNGKGIERQNRYNQLIENSAQLKSLECYQGSIYYQEPFYQLMRQTLWAEEVIKHQNLEDLKAVDFLHIHVIPKQNKDLLQKHYKVSKTNMETTWRNCLIDQSKYIIIDPADLLAPIADKYPELIEYLKTRYW